MSKKDSAQPDPIGDIAAPDIDKLLDETAALAAKAGEEVGQPNEEPPVTTAATDPETSVQSDSEIDAQLAELETMLEKAVESPESEPRREPERESDAPSDSTVAPATSAKAEESLSPSPGQEAAPAAAPGPGSPEATTLSDFNVSVDLSDVEDTAEKEIQEKLLASDRKSGAFAEPSESMTVLGRLLAAVPAAIGWLFIALDRPFAGLSIETKQLLGYIAIATMLVATTALIYGSMAHQY